jgi:hypothetical protein
MGLRILECPSIPATLASDQEHGTLFPLQRGGGRLFFSHLFCHILDDLHAPPRCPRIFFIPLGIIFWEPDDGNCVGAAELLIKFAGILFE